MQRPKDTCKSADGRLFCVTEKTASKLPERGWETVTPRGGPTRPVLEASYEGHDADNFEVKTITIHATEHQRPLGKISHLSRDAVSMCNSAAASMSLDMPNRVRLGKTFNITATFSFDDSEYDRRLWDDLCYNFVLVRSQSMSSGRGLESSWKILRPCTSPAQGNTRSERTCTSVVSRRRCRRRS